MAALKRAIGFDKNDTNKYLFQNIKCINFHNKFFFFFSKTHFQHLRRVVCDIRLNHLVPVPLHSCHRPPFTDRGRCRRHHSAFRRGRDDDELPSGRQSGLRPSEQHCPWRGRSCPGTAGRRSRCWCPQSQFIGGGGSLPNT